MHKDGNSRLPRNQNSGTPVKNQRNNSKSSEAAERLARIYASLSNLRAKTEISFSEDKEVQETANKTKSKTPTDKTAKKDWSNQDVFTRLTSPKSTKNLQTPKRNLLNDKFNNTSRRNLYPDSKAEKGRSGSLSSRSLSVRKMMIDSSGTELELSRSYINIGVTERVESEINERNKLITVGKLQGAQKYESKVMRKEMENQMKILENRLKKLAKEHENLQKDIQKSEKLEKKAIEYKSIKQEEIYKKEEHRIKSKLKQDEREERVKSLKRHNIEKLKESMATNRAKIAKLVNDLNKKMDEKKDEAKKKEEVENLNANSKRKEIIDSRKKRIFLKDTLEETRNLIAGINHSRFLEEEKKNMESLNTKISGLIKMEEVMIDRIKNTQCVKSTIDEKIKQILLSDLDTPKKKSSRL